MGKQENRGFALHDFPWKCYQCDCSVCNGRECPDKTHTFGPYRFHCADCVRSNGKLNIVRGCDFFRNKRTNPKYYRIAKREHREDIKERLERIEKLLKDKL